jgi:predicted PurR-regulated permease PerM
MNAMDRSWSRATLTVIVIVTVMGLAWIAAVASPFLGSLVIAALCAYLLSPLVRFITRLTRLRHSLAVLLVYLLFLLILVGIPALLGTVAIAQIRRLEQDLSAIGEALEQWLSQPIYVLGFNLHPDVFVDNLEQAATGALAALPSGSLNLLSGITTNLLWAMVVMVSVYYLLKDGPKIKTGLASLAPVEDRSEIRQLLDQIDRAWGLFLRVQLLILVIMAALIAAGAFLVVWLFRLAMLPLSPLGVVLMLVLLYMLVQQVDNLWLKPQLMGRELRLHPGLIIVGLTGALALSGVLGALIVVPSIATAKIVARYVYRKMLGIPPLPQAETDSPGLERATCGGERSEPSGLEASEAAPQNDEINDSELPGSESLPSEHRSPKQLSADE